MVKENITFSVNYNHPLTINCIDNEMSQLLRDKLIKMCSYIELPFT